MPFARDDFDSNLVSMGEELLAMVGEREGSQLRGIGRQQLAICTGDYRVTSMYPRVQIGDNYQPRKRTTITLAL